MMLLDDLIGDWTLTRAVDTPPAQAVGKATFIQIADTVLNYQEKGELVLSTPESEQAHRPITFTNAYRFCFHRPHVLDIEFPDGRLFHRLDLQDINGALTAQSTHLCGTDTYQSEYVFYRDRRFCVTHRVSGAIKRYASKTLFHKELVKAVS